MKQALGLPLALAVVVIGFGLSSEYFFTRETFLSIANDLPTLLVMAVGMTFVLIIGGIDLSVGSVLALSGGIVAGRVAGLALAGAAGRRRGAGLRAALRYRHGRDQRGVAHSFLHRDAGHAGDRARQCLPGHGFAHPVRGWSDRRAVDGHWPSASRLPSCWRWPWSAARSSCCRARWFGRELVGIGTNEEAMRLAGVDRARARSPCSR